MVMIWSVIVAHITVIVAGLPLNMPCNTRDSVRVQFVYGSFKEPYRATHAVPCTGTAAVRCIHTALYVFYLKLISNAHCGLEHTLRCRLTL